MALALKGLRKSISEILTNTQHKRVHCKIKKLNNLGNFLVKEVQINKQISMVLRQITQKLKKKKDLPQKTPSPGNQANHKEKRKEKYKKVLGMLVEFIALHNTTKGIFHDIAKNLELKIKLDA